MISKRRPDPHLRFEPDDLGLAEAARAFYLRGTVAVARDLIGAFIARRWRGRWYGARIVETEAYLGARDAAAHSFGGRRKCCGGAGTVGPCPESLGRHSRTFPDFRIRSRSPH
jgi:hypothetical protein